MIKTWSRDRSNTNFEMIFFFFFIIISHLMTNLNLGNCTGPGCIYSHKVRDRK